MDRRLRKHRLRGAAGLEVEPGPVSDPFGGDGMYVALPQDQVVLSLHLDLEAVLRVEQHLVARP